jgi:biopolymer transport protein ExbB
MEINLIKVFEEMTGFGLVIVAGLVIMAISSIAVFLERLWIFRRSLKRAADLVSRIDPQARDGNWAEVGILAMSAKGGPFANLVQGMVKVWTEACHDGGNGMAERIRNEASRRLDVAEADHRRGMSILASVGSIAPFVGLLGTVVGIIAAFEGIAAENASGIGSVAAGIAEALIVTAIGLAVAIPAVLLFNYLNSRVDSSMLALRTTAGEMADAMTYRPFVRPQPMAVPSSDRREPRPVALVAE